MGEGGRAAAGRACRDRRAAEKCEWVVDCSVNAGPALADGKDCVGAASRKTGEGELE